MIYPDISTHFNGHFRKLNCRYLYRPTVIRDPHKMWLTWYSRILKFPLNHCWSHPDDRFCFYSDPIRCWFINSHDPVRYILPNTTKTSQINQPKAITVWNPSTLESQSQESNQSNPYPQAPQASTPPLSSPSRYCFSSVRRISNNASRASRATS